MVPTVGPWPKEHPAETCPLLSKVHDKISESWNMPLTSRAHNPRYSLLSLMDCADRVEEAVAAHLCPAATANWRVRNRASLSSKPCHATANFTGKSFSIMGQAASALHVMVILQVHQAKLVKSLDEGRPDPEVFKQLVHAMDLALRATNLWLTLTELKD